MERSERQMGGAGAEPKITPMGLPAGVPLVVLFGGTFDPPHRAHVTLPARARDELERRAVCEGRAWLVYVPAARSPLKARGPHASDSHRIAMLRLALDGTARAAIWTDEIDRASAAPDQPSYTIDTLRRARSWLDSSGRGGGGAVLRLLIGADQAVQFHRWKDHRGIAAIAEPVVMLRTRAMAETATTSPTSLAGFIHDLGQAGVWSPDEISEWMRRIVDDRVAEACSTDARAYLMDAHSRRTRRDLLVQLLDGRVLGYIEQNGLYLPPA